jgi:hypothetical protein
MKNKQIYILSHTLARENACNGVKSAPEGFMVVISEPVKKRIQEEKYHAMINDIAKVATFMGNKVDSDDWKRLLVDMFAKVMRDAGTPLHHDGRVIPSLDFERVVQLGIQTKDFYVKEAAEFIEYLYSYGAECGVTWTEPKAKDLR